MSISPLPSRALCFRLRKLFREIGLFLQVDRDDGLGVGLVRILDHFLFPVNAFGAAFRGAISMRIQYVLRAARVSAGGNNLIRHPILPENQGLAPYIERYTKGCFLRAGVTFFMVDENLS